MLAISDEREHRLVHLHELILRERLLLLAIVQRLLDFGPEKIGLDTVNNLQLLQLCHELTLKRNFRLTGTVLLFVGSGRYYRSS